ncbi:GATA transcription factor 5-like [Neltuma alba]|uniref:GATA transcription factor 5-like n=1 Tax=Neltuma alba TaxID=207710 RepID=UPI0010A2D1FB|nr:GATA transcription factor 5-like [Prosopis alba]
MGGREREGGKVKMKKRKRKKRALCSNWSMDAFSPHSMLYQTHHHLLLHFLPFPPSISHLPTPSPLYRLSLPQAETQMECVEAALKTSFPRGAAVKLDPLSPVDDSSASCVPNAAPSDDFSIDELLDFSHLEEPFEDEQHQKPDSASVSPPPLDPSREISHFTFPSSVKDDVDSLPSGELSVPADDLANLEWLSHFVEDSFSVGSAAYPAGTLMGKAKSHAEPRPEPDSRLSTHPCFKTPVPAKARSKRTRTGVRVWPFRSPSLTESSSSSTSSSSSSSPTSPWLISASAAPEQVCFEAKPPSKRPLKKPAPEAAAGTGGTAQTARRCTHCGVHRTPQWRAGPLGAKTLCNACGVRYKSGRLLPEYRPACSPTFSSELHSNHHRKVLEMRRKKEGMGGGESGLGPATTPAVPSFG